MHHGHDAPEFGNEAAEHAHLVHAAQHLLGIILRAQHLHEQAQRLRVLAQVAVDEVQGPRRQPHGIRMEGNVALVRDVEHADEVHRVALEGLVIGHVQPVIVDDEIRAVLQPGTRRALAQAVHHALEAGHRLVVAGFQRGGEDGGEIAHILRHEEIVLHEAFHVPLAGMLGIAEPLRHLPLHLEGQALLGAAGQEMQVAAHGPQEVLAAGEKPSFLAGEHPFATSSPVERTR